MIKMNPALPERYPRRQPPLIGTGSGTKINDLDIICCVTNLDQVVDQLRQQGGQSCGSSGGVGGDPG